MLEGQNAHRQPERAAEVAGFGIHVTIIEPGGFTTDWGGPSAKHAHNLPAYDEVREVTGKWRAARMQKQGDPTASALAVLKVVDAEEPPLRVFFGDGPMQIATAEYEQRLPPGESGSRYPWRRRDNGVTY